MALLDGPLAPLLARAAVQAREVAEARAEIEVSIEEFLDALTQQGQPAEVRAAVSTCLTIVRAAARLARAGGEGE